MFEGVDFPKSLDEEVFELWLEEGRQRKRGYNYLIIIWDAYESRYRPYYVEDRSEIDKYKTHNKSTVSESLVAAYDLYSESKII